MINFQSVFIKVVLACIITAVAASPSTMQAAEDGNQVSAQPVPKLDKDIRTAWENLRAQATRRAIKQFDADQQVVIDQVYAYLSEVPRDRLFINGRVTDQAQGRLAGVQAVVTISTPSRGLIPGQRPEVKLFKIGRDGAFSEAYDGSSASLWIVKEGYYPIQTHVSDLPQMTKQWLKENLHDENKMRPVDMVLVGLDFTLEKKGELTTLDYRLANLTFDRGNSTSCWQYDPEQRNKKLKNGSYEIAGSFEIEPVDGLSDRGIVIECATQPDSTIKTVIVPMNDGQTPAALPEQVLVKMLDEGSGFIPIGFSDLPERKVGHANRRAPEEGYKQQLAFDQDDIEDMYRKKYWFYIKYGKFYGRGYLLIRPGTGRGIPSPDKPYQNCVASLYVAMQPDGTTNLETGE